jgi:hypothetical protein
MEGIMVFIYRPSCQRIPPPPLGWPRLEKRRTVGLSCAKFLRLFAHPFNHGTQRASTKLPLGITLSLWVPICHCAILQKAANHDRWGLDGRTVRAWAGKGARQVVFAHIWCSLSPVPCNCWRQIAEASHSYAPPMWVIVGVTVGVTVGER